MSFKIFFTECCSACWVIEDMFVLSKCIDYCLYILLKKFDIFNNIASLMFFSLKKYTNKIKVF